MQMFQFDLSKKINGIFYYTNPAHQNFDEDTYLSIREKEGRLYPDRIVKNLPLIASDHPLKREWLIRKKSIDKLLSYFSKLNGKIFLEIGCGNGWLSNRVASNTKNVVAGLDLNQHELIQAARVFGANENLYFVYGNIYENIFPAEIFDVIFFSSSIQYFPNLMEIICRAFYFLKPDGEIHIIDSFFYDGVELQKAAERTSKYFNKLGFPSAANYYFHRSWNELKTFNYKVVNKNNLSFQKILKTFTGINRIIFPWIIIKK